MKRSIGALLVLWYVVLSVQGYAQDPNALLKKWNAIITNDITNIGEIEGRIFVGNNYNISNSHQFGFKLTSNPVSDIVFAVGGSVTTNGQANIKVFYGSAAIAGTVSQSNWFQMMNGGTLQQSSTWPQTNSPVTAIKQAADYWKTLTPNGTISAPGSQPAPLKFICPAGKKVAVFSITDVQSFENSKVQQIEVIPADSTNTIIINVASLDGTVNWNYGNMVGNFDNEYWRSRIIWNVYTTVNNGQMTAMNCSPNMKGALIVPTATVTGNSNFDGPVVCKNLAITSEIHLASSTGWNGNAPQPVVEPVCTETWSANLGTDSLVCQHTATVFSTNAVITKQPANAPGYITYYWKVVSPSYRDTSTNYVSKWIYSDTTITISGNWPGVLSGDTLVKLQFGISMYDCNLQPIGNTTSRNFIWNPTVCPAPAPQQADIVIEKTVSRDSVANGEQVSFIVTAKNLGPQTATNVTVHDQLATGLTYNSHSATTGIYSPASGSWSIPQLTVGQTAQLAITATAGVTAQQNGSLSLGVAAPFNLFVLEDFYAPSSDVEGRMAVGRNASMQGYSVGDKLPVSNYANDDVLVVGNNLTFLTGAVFNGNIVYGNSTNLPQNSVSIVGGTLRKDSVINFTSAKAQLLSLSGQLAGMPATGTTTYQWGGIFMEGTNPVTNVFTVDGTMLSTANDVQIRVPNGSVVIVNVLGDTLSWQGGFELFGTSRTNVLFNFRNAEKLHIQGIDITAAVLAPKASVTYPAGVVNGQFICKSMSGSGQFNYCPFLGNIPVDSVMVNNAYLTASSPVDPQSSNNSASVSFKVAVTNNGSSGQNNWQPVSGSANSAMVTDMVTDLQGTLFAARQGGTLYKSTNNGLTWTYVENNLSVANIWSLAVAGNNQLLAATEQGLYISVNNGQTFSIAGLQSHDVRDVVIASSGAVFAATWDAGVWKASSISSQFTAVNQGLSTLAVHALAVMGDTVFCGTFGSGIYRLNPSATTWEPKTSIYDYIWTLAVTNQNVLLAGTYGGGIYRSTDRGETWQESFSGLQSRYIYQIHISNTGIAYASAWAAGVFVSTNSGQTWSAAGLEGLGINLVFSTSSVQKSSTTERVYAAAGNGMVYYTDSPLGINDSRELPGTFALAQNYPNPFNPSTVISVSIPRAAFGTLEVYSMLGEKVATLFSGEFKAGTNMFTFNAQGFASGIYIYRVHTAQFTAVKKMMILK